jgi:hypothetical protein
MRRCPQCQQVYDDETNFCLSDGTTLVTVSGSFTTESETPTVVRHTPAPTVYSQAQPPPSYGNAPFIPPVSSAPPESNKSNTLLIAALVGLIALVVGGAIVGLIVYGLKSPDNKNTNGAGNTNSNDKTSKSPSPDKKSETDERAENLKQEQEKLEKERQKLENERKALENKKKEAAQTTPKSSDATTAVIVDPPSNIRSAPNGAVQCVARTRGTVVNILGSTGVYDNNGSWYYTDYCGRQGVIHSSQIRF